MTKRKLFLGCAAIATVAATMTAVTGCSMTLPSDVAAGAPNGSNADKATQMNVQVTNKTQETINLVSASHASGVTHWQMQAPKTIAPGGSATVSDYGSGDNSIDLKYQGATSGSIFTFHAADPLIGSNSISGSSTSASYQVTGSNSTGHNDYSVFSVVAGHQFSFTGGAQSYTVPAGVTEMNVDVVAGSGGSTFADGLVSGAEITGILHVTPGEVLSIGVGGAGSRGYESTAGGWGLPYNGSSFSGGNGFNADEGNQGGGGGGASVILDKSLNPSQQVLVVAGGAGGNTTGKSGGGSLAYTGGRGGYNGSLTGEDGHGSEPGVGTGGKAGSMDGTQGQDSPTVGTVPGAGGGGYKGGASGLVGYAGGGGAGSSYDADLTRPTVKTAGSGGQVYERNGSITLTAVTS
jgi:hypothetical protein